MFFRKPYMRRSWNYVCHCMKMWSLIGLEWWNYSRCICELSRSAVVPVSVVAR